MTIKPQYCPPSKQCSCHLISANFLKLIPREKNLRSWELNPGLQGEKQVCYPLCYAAPLFLVVSLLQVCTPDSRPTRTGSRRTLPEVKSPTSSSSPSWPSWPSGTKLPQLRCWKRLLTLEQINLVFFLYRKSLFGLIEHYIITHVDTM